MAEHATSGIKFAGRVSQLITASTGFDDWEWGVTLWARSPEDIKEIVYTMRFDRASARYAEFGSFYISYVMSPAGGAGTPADLRQRADPRFTYRRGARLPWGEGPTRGRYLRKLYDVLSFSKSWLANCWLNCRSLYV